MNNNNLGEFIYSLVNDFYSSYILKSSKPQQNQWTVISAIILENNNKYKIITFSNGTKSLPNFNYKSRKFQIFDCHAEILALRCFKFFLLNTLIYHLDKLNEKNLLNKNEYDLFNSQNEFFDIFEYNKINNKFIIKKGVNFHLYISENPCGECSNIEFKNNNQQNINEMTGSKTLEEYNNFIDKNKKIDIKQKKLEKNNEYNFMTKSIRSDFKINNLSYSLSCTDKIMLRNILGYQGKYLSSILEPIYLNSITINTSLLDTKENKNIFKNCINYNYRKKTENNSCKIPEIYLINNINNSNNFKEKNEKNSLPFSTYWYFPNSVKKVDPSNGIKTGGNIKNIDDIDFLRVKISNYDLCKNIFNFLISFKKNKIFKKAVNKIEKMIMNNINNIDFYDLGELSINNKYIELKKNILDENKDVKNFIGKKRKILKME